ncbi:Metallophosphoesterase domain-containing protein 1 [Lasiodiplodia hormozganensis]|uniref:Metallophosphoesterase domain-containing protein 1 n=1 Tax=Lasiodiplodia hormozganensis TaxID=869390 RepID=A0AA39YDV1_9PEZI|nr:Metallophosphoesterase domain-containing protein 1 [Lasiodiplodia hormozganensis]
MSTTPSPSDIPTAQTPKTCSRSRSESPAPAERPAKRTAAHDINTHAKRPVKFLILSDTHDGEDDEEDTDSSFHPPTVPVDVVLHCGDLTQNGTLPSLNKAITKLASIPAQLRLMIAGNHEITLDESYYLRNGGSISTHAAVLHLVEQTAAAQGVTYLHEGTHTFTLPNDDRGGTTTTITFTVFASPYTPQHGESAFQYPSAHDRFNPPGSATTSTPPWATNVATPRSTIPEGIDVVMTHGPPKYVLDATGDGRSAGCEHLRRAVCRARPRLHCFGHVHGGYGAQRVWFKDEGEDGDDDGMVSLPKEFVGRNEARRRGYAQLSPASREAMREHGQTLMVNAAVEGEDGRATNVPWLVELEL